MINCKPRALGIYLEIAAAFALANKALANSERFLQPRKVHPTVINPCVYASSVATKLMPACRTSPRQWELQWLGAKRHHIVKRECHTRLQGLVHLRKRAQLVFDVHADVSHHGIFKGLSGEQQVSGTALNKVGPFT